MVKFTVVIAETTGTPLGAIPPGTSFSTYCEECGQAFSQPLPDDGALLAHARIHEPTL